MKQNNIPEWAIKSGALLIFDEKEINSIDKGVDGLNVLKKLLESKEHLEMAKSKADLMEAIQIIRKLTKEVNDGTDKLLEMKNNDKLNERANERVALAREIKTIIAVANHKKKEVPQLVAKHEENIRNLKASEGYKEILRMKVALEG